MQTGDIVAALLFPPFCISSLSPLPLLHLYAPTKKNVHDVIETFVMNELGTTAKWLFAYTFVTVQYWAGFILLKKDNTSTNL